MFLATTGPVPVHDGTVLCVHWMLRMKDAPNSTCFRCFFTLLLSPCIHLIYFHSLAEMMLEVFNQLTFYIYLSLLSDMLAPLPLG